MLQLLIAPITSLIERIFPDKAAQDKAKAEMMTIIANADAEAYKAKGKIIEAEAKGESWMQRNWRPLLMMTFIAIIINNYILMPYLAMFGVLTPKLALPPEMWTLLTVGVGGYIVGRSGEKIYKNINEQKFYQALREEVGPMSQEHVNALNRALKKGQQ